AIDEGGKLVGLLNGVGASRIAATGGAGHENVEIADGFASSPQGAGRYDLFDSRVIAQVVDNLLGLRFGGLEKETASNSAIVFDGLEQLLLVFFAHPRQDSNFAFTAELLHAFEVRHLVRAPDQRDGFGTEALNFQQLQHGRVVLFEQLGMQFEPALTHHLFQVLEHAFANTGDGQDLFRFRDQI